MKYTYYVEFEYNRIHNEIITTKRPIETTQMLIDELDNLRLVDKYDSVDVLNFRFIHKLPMEINDNVI